MSAIIVTGAGTGLGKALAVEYSSNFETVILIGRTKEALEQTKRELEEMNKQAFVYPLDITDYEAVQRAAEELAQQFTIQGLINNAGYGAFGPLESITESDIHKMLDTNVKGTIFMTKAFITVFKEQNQSFILNIVSTAGLRGKVNESVYVASKFAVRGFSESLVKELEGSNVEIKAAYMGGMDTPFWDDSDHIKDKSRLRSPMDVAKKIRELDDGRFEIIIE
ncbi:SDR family NAD(P)-dependent oxidoreductase [Bacillus kexueae]|uniref:SDR family NAD(P)-dependent oxidoreductase n=1 Tax=Aeribacillus kexueae TaxID=2078952 RepID=UPI001FAEB6A1|nr:SDR family NAD(P)-dependent oxidoreductase [Bacillus kexueae]